MVKRCTNCGGKVERVGSFRNLVLHVCWDCGESSNATAVGRFHRKRREQRGKLEAERQRLIWV